MSCKHFVCGNTTAQLFRVPGLVRLVTAFEYEVSHARLDDPPARYVDRVRQLPEGFAAGLPAAPFLNSD
jgi:hypothetical protein